MSTPEELTGRLGTARSASTAILDRFPAWWAERDPAASELLDELARRGRNDAEALDLLLTLVVRHRIARPALHRTLIDQNDIADAEQATLAAVAMRLDRFDGRSRFTTWLHAIADNEAKMLIRSRERRPSTPTDQPEVAPFLARLSTILADRDVIDRALAGLPDRLRRPLELRELDGLDYAEIAATLEIEIGTVRSRLSRGRAELVTILRHATDDAS